MIIIYRYGHIPNNRWVFVLEYIRTTKFFSRTTNLDPVVLGFISCIHIIILAYLYKEYVD